MLAPERCENLLDTVGGTPLVKLSRLVPPGAAEIFGKLESQNPGGSIKDRIALSMIETAEREGRIRPGQTTIIEATTGNTGVGLALCAAIKGYKLICVMPESMSLERRALVEAYGVEVVLTPAELDMAGAVARAAEIAAAHADAFIPRQFENVANPAAHQRTTAREILAALLDRRPDAFVAGVGTGGTITGVGRVLKESVPACRIVAVEPDQSAVLSGAAPGPHKIQGIGAGFVPAVLDRAVIDEIRRVADRDAYETKCALARKEGILAGISSGAATFAAIAVARELGRGKLVVAVLPDTGERDFSMDEYFQ